jgi:hypothetical protein
MSGEWLSVSTQHSVTNIRHIDFGTGNTKAASQGTRQDSRLTQLMHRPIIIITVHTCWVFCTLLPFIWITDYVKRFVILSPHSSYCIWNQFRPKMVNNKLGDGALVTRLQIRCPKNRSCISDREQFFFSYPKRPEQVWGPSRPPVSGYVAFSRRVNGAGAEVEHSHLVVRLRMHEVGTFITDDDKNSLSLSLFLR